MPSPTTGRRPFLRSPWVAPIAVTSAVALALVSQPLFAAGEANELPEVSAEELITKVLDAEPLAMSGTVVHTARLGLPDMLFTEATGADPISLLGGSSTLRVWTDGEERSRVALLGTMSEYSVVADGPEMWTYSSAEDQAVHYSVSDADLAELESMTEEARAEMLKRQAELPTPQEAAEQALAMVNEYSTVKIDSQSTVAGRDVYQVIVTPTSENTLVKRVALAIDVLHASGPVAQTSARLVGIVLGTIFRFWTYRQFVFVRELADLPPVPHDPHPPAQPEAAGEGDAGRPQGLRS